MNVSISQLEQCIRDFIKDSRKIAILTIGNPLRGDDAAGVVVGKKLKGNVGVDVFIGETAPESYVIKIVDSGYSHVIIIDTAVMSHPPGSIFVVDKNRIVEGIMTTHSIPISLIVDFLEANNIKTLIIGIQPKNTDFVRGLSEEVENAVNKLVDILSKLLTKRND